MNSTAITSLLDLVDPELWVVTAQADDRKSGLIAACVTSASIVPEMPRMVVGLSRQQCTQELVEASGHFALHLFGEQHIDWVWRFALQSGREQDKFAGLAWRTSAGGSPLLAKAIGWLDCRVEARLDIGDRTFYLAEVLDGACDSKQQPLTFRRLLELGPGDKLKALKDSREYDAELAVPLIQQWRRQLANQQPPR